MQIFNWLYNLWSWQCYLCNKSLPAHERDICELCYQGLINKAILCCFCGKSLDYTDTSTVCDTCVNHGSYLGSTIIGVTNQYSAKKLINGWRHHDYLFVATILAKLLYAQLDPNNWPDLLIPIPSHKNTLKKLGFSPSNMLAHELSKLTGIKVNEKILMNIMLKPLSSAKLWGRSIAVKSGFALDQKLISNLNLNNIAIVDDYMHTGVTLKEVAKLLIRNDMVNVQALVGVSLRKL